jgi:hypothetical protein
LRCASTHRNLADASVFAMIPEDDCKSCSRTISTSLVSNSFPIGGCWRTFFALRNTGAPSFRSLPCPQQIAAFQKKIRRIFLERRVTPEVGVKQASAHSLGSTQNTDLRCVHWGTRDGRNTFVLFARASEGLTVQNSASSNFMRSILLQKPSSTIKHFAILE